MRRRYFLFSGIFVPCGTFGPPRRESAGGVCQGKVSERSKEHAWKVCIPQKGIAGSNPAFSARYPSDPLKAPPNFGGAFRLYASGERSESSQAVYPAARILRSPRRAAERSGRARFGPADSGSYVGRRSGSGNPRRIDPYILSTCLSCLPEDGSWPRPPGTVHAGQSVRIPVFPIRAEKGIFSCRAFYKIQAQYLNVSATDREKISRDFRRKLRGACKCRVMTDL